MNKGSLERLWDSPRRLRGFSKSPSPNPLSSLSQKFHESPSGLAVPDSLNGFLSTHASMDARFSDLMGNSWLYSEYVCSCGVRYRAGDFHVCSGAKANAIPANQRTWNGYPAPSYAFDLNEAMPSLPVEKRDMPVIGFRAWKTEGAYTLGYGMQWRLKSTGARAAWLPGVNVAKCGAHGGGCTYDPGQRSPGVPNEHHRCGLYVLASVNEVAKHFPNIGADYIVGAVLGWGRVIQHGGEGWRAQRARIVALMDMKLNADNDERARAISQAYGVPILERAALEAYVSEFGDPIED